MASSTEYSMLFKLGAQLGKEFNGTFSSAQKTLSETQKQIISLNKQQGDITAYGKQQQAVDATNRKLADLKKEYDNIQREIQETGTFSSALENKLISKKQAIDKTSDSLQKETEKLGTMKSALQEAGVDTDNLSGESAKLTEQIDALAEEQAEAAKSADGFGESGASAFEAVGSALIAAGVLNGLKEIAAAYAECVTGAAAYADEIGTVSAQYGIAEDDLQAYYYAAELVDVSADTLTKSMAKQIKSMGAVQEGTTQSVEAYEKLGVSVLNADGSLRNADDVYWEVIDALGQMSNETERDSIAQQILGRSAMELNTLIKAGSGVLKDYAAEAKDAGYVMTDEMLAACMAMDDEMQRSKSGTIALKNTLGAVFAPEITSVTKLWNQFLAGVTEFAANNPVVVKAVIALAAEAGVLLGIYTAYVAVKKTMNTIRALSAALKAKETVATVAGTAATAAQATATTAATAAQTGLNTAMSMNPIGIVLIAVAALTVGVIALSEAEKSNADNVRTLTAASREQYGQLQELNAEYDAACDAYGESSEQARALHGELLLLQSDYDNSRQTIAEFNEEVKKSTDEYYSFAEEHRNSISELNSEEDVLMSLVTRLQTLEKQTNKTESEKEKMVVLVDQLNSKLPQLGLSYDKVNDSLNSTADAIRNVVEADISRKKYEENYEAYYEAVEREIELEKQLQTAKENTAIAQKEYDDILSDSGTSAKERLLYQIQLEKFQETQNSLQSTYDDAISMQNSMLDSMGAYKQEMAETSSNTEDADKNTKKLSDALNSVRNGYMDVSKAASYYGISDTVLQDAVDSAEEYRTNLENAVDAVNQKWYSAEEAARIYGVAAENITVAAGIQNTIDKIDELSTKYNEVKTAAEQSIQGQYDIWDKASVVISKSIGDINTSLETQMSYWSDYNTDLANLLSRADEIDGLGDVIASFADGSDESVNAIAGMASASNEDLKTMVSNWQKVQAQQEEASKSIAEITTGYEDQMNDLQADLAESVNELNLDTEAASAAKATVDAYTQAIKDGTKDAVGAAENLAALVASALQNVGVKVDMTEANAKASSAYGVASAKFAGNSQQNQTFRALLGNKSPSYSAYASGTSGAAPGMALVGENGPELVAFGGGEKVFTAQETKDLMRYVQDGTFVQAYADGTGDALQILTILPLLQSYVEAVRNSRADALGSPATAERISDQSIIITVSPTFTIEGNAGDGIEERLKGFADEIKDEVMDALEEAGIDAKRGAYV